MKEVLTGASSKTQLQVRTGEMVSTQRQFIVNRTRFLEKGARHRARRCS